MSLSILMIMKSRSRGGSRRRQSLLTRRGGPSRAFESGRGRRLHKAITPRQIKPNVSRLSPSTMIPTSVRGARPHPPCNGRRRPGFMERGDPTTQDGKTVNFQFVFQFRRPVRLAHLYVIRYSIYKSATVLSTRARAAPQRQCSREAQTRAGGEKGAGGDINRL